MRKYACEILGVPENANEEQIKTAYKRLVKQYHPDTGNTANVEYYHRIVEAYEYLRLHPVQVQMNYGKVLGGKGTIPQYYNSYSKAKEYAKFEKTYQQQKEEKKTAFDERIKREKEEVKQKQERYERAMEAINAIRAAEAIKAYIRKNQ